MAQKQHGLAACIFFLTAEMCVSFFFLSLPPPSVELNMVQLSPSPTLDVSLPLERSEEGSKRQEDQVMAGSPKVGSPAGLNALQLSLDVSTAYHGYDTYIEDGLICLKHKVRNLEKKKVGWTGAGVKWEPPRLVICFVVCPQLKLEDYKKRLNQGQALNKDQMVRWDGDIDVIS